MEESKEGPMISHAFRDMGFRYGNMNKIAAHDQNRVLRERWRSIQKTWYKMNSKERRAYWTRTLVTFTNQELQDLLSGKMKRLSLSSPQYQYFQELLPLLQPIDCLEELEFCHIITSIEGCFLNHFPKLKELTFSCCKNIHFQGLPNLSTLESISLFRCPALQAIYLDVFQNTKLVKIHLEDMHHQWDKRLCLPSTLQELTVKNCPFLEEIIGDKSISMKHLTLSNLPKLSRIVTCTWQHLTTLSLHALESIDIVLCPRAPLKILSLSKCHFTIFPHQIFAMTALQEVSLQNLSWRFLPVLGDAWRNLEKLDLHNMPLVSIPGIKWSNLESFVLEKTKVSELSDEFFLHSPKLRRFSVRNTPLTLVPILYEVMNTLETFELVKTKVRHLPQKMTQCKNLKTFRILDCQLDSFPLNWTLCELISTFDIQDWFLEKDLIDDCIYFGSSVSENILHEKIKFRRAHFMSPLEFRYCIIDFHQIPIPSYLMCVICRSLLFDPVINYLGYTYCNQCICTWVETSLRDPYTNQKLQRRLHYPNRGLESAAHHFLDAHENLFSPIWFRTQGKSIHQEKNLF